MQPRSSEYVLWLLPEQQSKVKIKACIESLSRRFSTPVFEPHITLAKVPDRPVKELKNLVHLLCGQHFSIPVSLDLPHCGEPPFQRFSATIKNPDKIIDLSNCFDSLCDGSFGKKSGFHLSYLYGSTSCDELLEFVNSAREDFLQILYIQRLALVDVSGDVPNWKIMYEAELK